MCVVLNSIKVWVFLADGLVDISNIFSFFLVAMGTSCRCWGPDSPLKLPILFCNVIKFNRVTPIEVKNQALF